MQLSRSDRQNGLPPCKTLSPTPASLTNLSNISGPNYVLRRRWSGYYERCDDSRGSRQSAFDGIGNPGAQSEGVP
jgi:hypothetical protein